MASGNRPVQIRIDDETRSRWQAAADESGMKLIEWIRDAANARLVKGGKLELGSEVPQPSQFPRPQMQEIGKSAPPRRRPAPTGQLDLKKVDQPLCPHRVPLTAYCPHCR